MRAAAPAPVEEFGRLDAATRERLAAATAAAVERHRVRRRRREAAAAARAAAAAGELERRAAVAAAERVAVRGREGRRRWLARVEQAVAGRAGGMTRTTGRLAGELVRYADHDTGGEVRPTWTRLQDRLGLGRSTLAKHLQLLRAAGLLAYDTERQPLTRGADGSTVSGRHATLTEILTLGVYRMAATYRLTLPLAAGSDSLDRPEAPAVRPEPDLQPAQLRHGHGVSWTPPQHSLSLDGPGRSTDPRDARGTGHTAGGRSAPQRRDQVPKSFGGRRRYDRNHLPHPRSRRYPAYSTAVALDLAAPLLFGQERVSAIAHAIRPAVDAHWTVQDILAHLNTQPLPTHNGLTSVRHPARFLAARLAEADLSARPTLVAAARAQAAAAAHTTAVAARRAAAVAERERAVPAAQSSAAPLLAALRARLAAANPDPRARVLRQLRSR